MPLSWDGAQQSDSAPFQRRLAGFRNSLGRFEFRVAREDVTSQARRSKVASRPKGDRRGRLRFP